MPENLEELAMWRRTRLIELAKKAGGNAALGKKLGYDSGAFIGQMAKGHRPVGEKTIAAIEALPEYRDWFSGANSQTTVELTKSLISSGSGESAGYLLLRLTDILGPLSPWLQDSAVKLIAQTVASPALAVVNAAKFEELLKLEAPAARTADEANQYALERLEKISNIHEASAPSKQRKEK